ncbi:MAG: UvrD-helicase domain-containing protein [Deltaproteobacteria bacterium]|nr:UvrD-helicase domain-containing protein [Deltaproteobacteria bacterium]
MSDPSPSQPPETWVDADARRAIREDLDQSLLVEAAAGTGKTESLVTRLVALLKSGRARLDQVAALTFAEKAAGEMKLRLRQRLEEARQATSDPEERERLEVAMGQIETAHVSTFHGFCADILREMPLEAGLDPSFVVAADGGDALYDRAFDRYWQRVLADPPVGVRRMLRERTWARDEGPRGALHFAGKNLVQHRDFPAPWGSAEAALDVAEMDRLVARLAELTPYASEGKVWDSMRKGFVAVHEFVRSVRYRRQAAIGDADALAEHAEWLDAGLRRMLGRNAGLYEYVGSYPVLGKYDRAEVAKHRDEVTAELEAWAERTGPTLAAQLQEALTPLIAAYEDVMRESATVDYLELLLRARELLRHHPGARRALRSRFTHVFVDEVQDADIVQMEIAWSLACDAEQPAEWDEATPSPGALFLVGDPKQSIYRFRRADLRLYQRLADRVTETGGAVIALRRSFRAVPGIHAFLNKAFAKAMVPEDGVQPAPVALESHRERSGTQPSVIALPVPRPYGKTGVTKGAMAKSGPMAIASFAAWLVRESGWMVEEAGERRAIAMRDICVLFRNQKSWDGDRVQTHARALEAQAIAHVAGGQKGGAEREELGALRQALGAIEWPDDALRVYATLRGPFFGVPDESLFLFHQTHGRIHPLDDHDPESASSEGERDVMEVLAILRELHVRRNERPLADTVVDLMERARIHAGVVLWRAGTNAMAHLRALVDRVRAMEAANPTSFRSLVERLEEDVELGRDVDTLPFEEEVDGVRLMTVHKAKGLEFPVVILADPQANGAGRKPTQWVDLEAGLWAERVCGASPAELIAHEAEAQVAGDAEELRILYVACTRARELLVVPAVGDGPPEAGRGDHGWLAPLHSVLYVSRKRRGEAGDAPGCPSMGEEATVLQRPHGMLTDDPMRPGRQKNGVVWWSAERLRAGHRSPTGVRGQLRELLSPKGKAAKAAIADHERWVAERESLRARASVPTLRGRTITALGAERGAELSAEIATVSTDAAHDPRPRGARFGTLVHLALAEVPFDADGGAIDALVRAHARLVGATDDERDAAGRAVRAALSHPLLVRAAAASRVRREVPLMLAMPDGTIAEGVADLAFEEHGDQGPRWTVVDYKTDLADGADDSYRGQIALYVEAIHAATGAPAEGILLGV